MDAYAEALGLAPPKRQAVAAPAVDALPPAEAGVVGNFDFTKDSPDNIAMAIAKLPPQERANAQAAFESQMRATGGKTAPKADPYAQALGLGEASKATTPAAPSTLPKGTGADAQAALTGHLVSSVAAPIGGGLAGIGKGLSTLLQTGSIDEALKSGTTTAQDVQNSLTYVPKTQQAQRAVQAFDSNYNPLTWIPKGLAYVGEKAGGALTDLGAPGLGAVVEGAANAAPMALGLLPKGARYLRDLGKTEDQAPKIEPVLDQKPRYRPENGQPVLVPQQVPEAPASPVAVSRPQAAPARSSQVAPEAPPMPTTPEAVQAVAEKAPSSLFPETPTAAPQGGFTRDQQLARAKVLESVGIDPNKIRRSAIVGDATGGSTDFQTAKLDTPAGREMRSIIEGEKAADERAAGAAPMALGLLPKGARYLRDLGKTEDQAPKIEPVLDQKPRYRLENGQPVLVPQQVPEAPASPVAVSRPQAAPARSSQVAPEAPPMPTTPEAVQAVAEKAPSSLFPETPTAAPQGGFTRDQQLARAKVLESVGIDPNKIRRSAIVGDATGGSTDFQTAKLDTPAGREMRSIIEGEKAAITGHADSLVGKTGGTHGVDQSALYARGNTILAPLDSMKQWFDNKTSALYKAADERAAGVPTQLNGFKAILDDSSELTNSDRVHLQSAVNAYIKKLGMAGEDGSVSGSAQQAETIRKYLNEQWSPANSKLVGKLKDALDEDVTASAGDDIYAEARKIRSLRAQTLDNPNGIAKLMDSSGPEGINRAVPVEKIADSVTGMPVDQFSHVVKTLREAPDELQPQAQAALAEVKAQFANKVHAIGSAQQGQWNAKGVTKYLQNNAARMAQVFTPEEMAQFRNLNDAGHILAKDQSYPGAAVQGHNLVTQGVMSGLPAAGAAIGGFVAGAPGAALGTVAGKMAAGSVENASSMKAVKKRTVKLSDLLETGRQ